jgi:hypothetical protein
MRKPWRPDAGSRAHGGSDRRRRPHGRGRSRLASHGVSRAHSFAVGLADRFVAFRNPQPRPERRPITLSVRDTDRDPIADAERHTVAEAFGNKEHYYTVAEAIGNQEHHTVAEAIGDQDRRLITG